jgi:hypothetical protein
MKCSVNGTCTCLLYVFGNWTPWLLYTFHRIEDVAFIYRAIFETPGAFSVNCMYADRTLFK